MNYTTVQQGLKEYNQTEVGIFINYLKFLQTEKKSGQIKNAWFQHLKEEQVINLYKKVSIDGLFIDGDTITLTFKGKLMVTYDYNAYKNRVLSLYPESLFDFQLVYQGDKFSFKKESGKVVYSHEITDPFSNDRVLIGAYGVLKNSRGEFLEVLNTNDVSKMKAVSKMAYIWDNWFDRMVLKSVIKRICKVNFKDKFKNIEAIDNENYDLNKSGEDEDYDKLVDTVANAETLEELQKIYDANKGKLNNEQQFLELLGNRKIEIKNGK